MYFDKTGHAWIANAPGDFDGAEILGVERYKPGVVKVYARWLTLLPYEFRVVFVKDELAKTMDLAQLSDPGAGPGDAWAPSACPHESQEVRINETGAVRYVCLQCGDTALVGESADGPFRREE